LGNNAAKPHTPFSSIIAEIGDDGFIALVSALEQNTSLLQLVCAITIAAIISVSGPFSARVYLRSKLATI
jgi:hypothetical protein